MLNMRSIGYTQCSVQSVLHISRASDNSKANEMLKMKIIMIIAC